MYHSKCNFLFQGPGLYYVDNDGIRVKGNLFSCGSGSLNAYSILDSFYQESMTDADAIDLGKRAIMHATYRDIGSGGGVNGKSSRLAMFSRIIARLPSSLSVYHITSKGQRFDSRTDVSDAYYDFMAKSKRDHYDPQI